MPPLRRRRSNSQDNILEATSTQAIPHHLRIHGRVLVAAAPLHKEAHNLPDSMVGAGERLREAGCNQDKPVATAEARALHILLVARVRIRLRAVAVRPELQEAV
jgi:hypothetical protein